MKRFFFHVYDDAVSIDPEGELLADVEAALTVARAGARALACEQVKKGRLHLAHRIEIADEAGAILAAVRFGDAVAVEGQG
jgi:hypothetical protein